MYEKIIIGAAAILMTSACQTANSSVKMSQSDEEIVSCIQTVRKLDEGRWAYMGTIARLNGKFRTYETTSVHAATGPDTWSSKSFGGDVGGTEEEAEIGHVKLVGTSMLPIEDGTVQAEGAVKYLSCIGPDVEGRYEARLDYKLPNADGTFNIAKNVTWYSEHGSYYVEDIFNQSGRVVARRSGVNTPANE